MFAGWDLFGTVLVHMLAGGGNCMIQLLYNISSRLREGLDDLDDLLSTVGRQLSDM